MISILIVDDHNIVRYSLRKMLMDNTKDLTIIGEAESGEQAIALVRELQPDVVLMDIQMPGIGGLEATQKLLKLYPTLKVIALTAHEEDPFPSSFIEAGAAGFLTKNTNIEELITAIHTAYEGHPYITPSIANRLVSLSHKIIRSPLTELSQREIQVFWLILRGVKIKDIADKMNLSSKTIATYHKRIFEKLNVKNDMELAQLAMRHGILDPTSLTKKK